jgi:integrase
MPEAKFVLKEPKSEQPTLVYMFLRFNGQTLKFSTGQKIHPSFWNDEKQRAKETRKFYGYEEFNSLLKNLANEVQTCFRKFLNDGVEPTPEKLREYLQERFYKKEIAPTKKPTTFFEFIDDYVETSNKKEGTKKQYKLAINNLKEYETYSKRKIEFSSVDIAFYDDFMRFLLGKNYSTNTIGSRIKNLKVFMNEAVQRGITDNVQFKHKRFTKPSEKAETIYLTVDEIKKLYELDLKDNPKLDRVRDLFIIGCYTGLRFSDLVQLRDENLTDNKTKLRVRTQKTGEIVIIPLHGYIREILNKHGGMPPEPISNQKMNDYLKELGKAAAMTQEIAITSTRGGKQHTEVYNKYQLITVHTARRSFATNAYLNDIPAISIMKITGHNTERAFMTYIKISQEENANKLLNHAFFK